MRHIRSGEFGLINGVICYSPAQLEEVLNTYTLPSRWTVVTRGTHLILYGDEQGGGGEIVTPEYQAVLDYATAQGYGLPSAGNQQAQNLLLGTLKDLEIWNELDLLYVPLGDGSADFARINWKAPGTHQATGGAFTVNNGIAGPCLTPWVPSINGVKFIQDNASMVYDQFIPDNGGDFFPSLGFETAPHTYNRLPKQASNTRIDFVVNGVNIQTKTSPRGANDFFAHQQRTAATVSRLFFDGVFIGETAEVSTGRSAASGSIAKQATAITRLFGVGSSLAGLEADLFNAWQTYAAPVKAAKVYADIIAYATSQAYTLPSAGQQVEQEKLIADLIAAGVWDQLQVFYNFYTDGSREFAGINWKAPGVSNLQNPGNTFTQNSGFGKSAAYNTVIVAPPYTLNDASIFVASKRDLGAGTDNILSPQPGISFNIFGAGPIYLQSSLNDNSAGNNQFSAVDVAYDSLWMVQRIAGPLRRTFRDGVKFGADNAGAVTATPTNAITFGSNPDPDSRNQCLGIGASLNGKELALFNAWSTYKSNA